MLQKKGKKSDFKIKFIYIFLGVTLLLGAIGGFIVWYVKLPHFVDLIICLGIISAVILTYFLTLRGVFLNKNAGYEINENFLICKDGFPNAKKHVVKLSEIDYSKISEYKNAFLITAICVFAIGIIALIVLSALIDLGIYILFVILGVILVSGYFVALHFLSLGLGKLKIGVSEKYFVIRNVPVKVLKNICQQLVKQPAWLSFLN